MIIPLGRIFLASLAISIPLRYFQIIQRSLSSQAGIFASIYLTLLTLVLAWRVVIYPKCLSPLRHLPHPSGASFFNGHWRRMLAEPTGTATKEWVNSVPNDGLICYTSLLNQERIIVTSPQAMGEVLTINCYDYVKPKFIRNSLERSVGIGLVLAEGEVHKIQRKNFMPAFSYRHIKDLAPVFWSKSLELVDRLRVVPGQDPSNNDKEKPTVTIHLDQWFHRYALDVIGSAGMGQEFGALENENTELSRNYRQLFKQTKSRIVLLLLGFFLPQWFLRSLPVEHNRNVSAGSKAIRGHVRRMIRQRQESLARGEKRSHVDVISVALESGISDEEELINNAMTFLTAGHETTATALAWAALQLGRSPETQRRLREEIRANLPSPSSAGPLDPDAIDKCHFLTAFCNEVLRLHGPVPLTFRRSVRVTYIAGQRIPANTQIVIPIWGINESFKLWGDDALEFKPDRWISPAKGANGELASNYRFQTFLAGPRSCIGSSFARSEMHYVLAALVGRFELDLANKDAPVGVKTGITSKPGGGVEVRLRVVDGW